MIKKVVVTIQLVFAVLIFAIISMQIVFPAKVEVAYNNILGAENVSDFEPELYNIGSTINEPKAYPYQGSKMFLGWYTDPEAENPANFPLDINTDTKLYAKYLSGNLPSKNIAYDSTNSSYYVYGTLDSSATGTLVIPDYYNDGTNGLHPITRIDENRVDESNLDGYHTFEGLIHNTSITTVYVGNEITNVTVLATGMTVGDESGTIDATTNDTLQHVVLGRKLSYINSTALIGCSNIETIQFFNQEHDWYWYNTQIDYEYALRGTQLDVNHENSDVKDKILSVETSGTEKWNRTPILAQRKSKADSADILLTYDVASMHNKEDFEPVVYKDMKGYEVDVLEPEFPQGVNLLFEGWYSDSEFTNKVTFPMTITDDTTLYPKFLTGSNTLVFTYNNSGYTMSSTTNAGTIIVPDYHDDGVNGVLPITTIGKMKKAEQVYIGNNVITIPSECFGSTTLKKIQFTNYSHLQSINSNAFVFCDGLTSIILPPSVLYIGSYAFNNCNYLNSITIPDSVISMGEFTFAGCDRLKSVTISNSVTTLETYVFAYCINLTSITIPSSVTTIEGYAFMDCSNLTSIVFDNPNGWYKDVSSTGSFTDGSYTLSDPNLNATYFRSTYESYTWKRK